MLPFRTPDDGTLQTTAVPFNFRLISGGRPPAHAWRGVAWRGLAWRGAADDSDAFGERVGGGRPVPAGPSSVGNGRSI